MLAFWNFLAFDVLVVAFVQLYPFRRKCIKDFQPRYEE
jgi:hypothetical protein